MARKLTEQERNNIDILVDMLHDALPANQRYLCAGIASALVRAPGNEVTEEDLQRILGKYGEEALGLNASVKQAVLDPVEGKDGYFTLKAEAQGLVEGQIVEPEPENDNSPRQAVEDPGGNTEPHGGAMQGQDGPEQSGTTQSKLVKTEPHQSKALAKVVKKSEKDNSSMVRPQDNKDDAGISADATAENDASPRKRGAKSGTARPRRHHTKTINGSNGEQKGDSADGVASVAADAREGVASAAGEGAEEAPTKAVAKGRRGRSGAKPSQGVSEERTAAGVSSGKNEQAPSISADGRSKKADSPHEGEKAGSGGGPNGASKSHGEEGSHDSDVQASSGASAHNSGRKGPKGGKNAEGDNGPNNSDSKGRTSHAAKEAKGSGGNNAGKGASGSTKDPSRDLKKVPYIRRGGDEEASIRQKIVSLDQRFWMNGWLLSHPGAYTLYERELTAISDALKNGMLPGDITRRQLAYQIGGDEKFFEYGSDGFKLLRAMGMEDLVRHPPMPKPDLLYHAPRRRKHMRVLVTENLDPWLDVRNLMYEDGRSTILGERIHAVVMGGGMPVLEQNRLSILLDSLGADTITVLYWGDIDRAGIDIMLRLKELLGDQYKFRAFMPAYKLMVQKAMERYPDPLDNEVTGQVNIEAPDISIISKGLSEEEIAYVQAVIDNCGLIPQEILTRRDL